MGEARSQASGDHCTAVPVCYNQLAMEKDNIKKLYKKVKSLALSDLYDVRDKLIPLFLDLEKKEPYKDKKVIKLLKQRYQLALKESKQKKLLDAEKYLRTSLG